MLSSKKGMSPLIATVLVIAFAVAIGVMILNWTTFDASQTSKSSLEYCDGLSLSVNPLACYKDGSVQFHVKNIGSKKFDGIQLKTITDAGNMEFTLKDSSMIPRESADKEVRLSYSGENIELKVVPFVFVDGDAIACLAGSYSQDSLPACD